MAGRIDYSLDIRILGSPTTSISQPVSVEAIDKIDVVVDGGNGSTPGSTTVNVQPGAAGKVKFLLIQSSLYTTALTYTVDGGSAIALDAPQLFVGSGSVGLLGKCQKFIFKNSAGKGKPASIQILVGRDAKE